MFCVQNVIECNKVAQTLIKAFGKVSMLTLRVFECTNVVKKALMTTKEPNASITDENMAKFKEIL